jgi:mono/diheme cytochrome c family protein
MSAHPPKPPRPRRIPRPVVFLLLIAIAMSWIPFALIALKRTTITSNPPFHPFQDMDVQPKLKTQALDETFNDRRAMREPIFGTVARGRLADDDHFHRGYETDPATGEPILVKVGDKDDYKWIDGYPEQVEITLDFIKQGQVQYNIYCAPCHGMTGRGNGMVHRRAVQNGSTATGWVQPSNMIGIDPNGKSTYSADGSVPTPDGRMFNLISHGIRSMPGYATQISVEDRWAIVAYIRALQLSQNARLEDVPADERAGLR